MNHCAISFNEILHSEDEQLTRYFVPLSYDRLKQQFDLKSREAELVEERLKQSRHHHKVEEVKSLEDEIGNAAELSLLCDFLLIVACTRA